MNNPNRSFGAGMPPPRPHALPPLAGGSRLSNSSPFLVRRAPTPDLSSAPTASPAMMQYGAQVQADLAPLIKALLTEQPDDTQKFCANFFAQKKSGAERDGATAKPAAAGAAETAEAPTPSTVHSTQSTAALLAPRAQPFGVVPDAQLSQQYDVIVIGGGPAGVAAAVQAAFFGRRALLIDDPGGTDPCTLDLGFGAPTGLYSKALRDSAKSIDVQARRAAGRTDAEIWTEVGVNIERLATNNAETQYQLLEDMRVEHLRARATVTGAESLVATLPDGTEKTISGSFLLVATGSSPTRPKGVPFDGARIFDCDSIAALKFLPRSVVSHLTTDYPFIPARR
jgi:hypothetical protein